jgi:hypothetical protein
LRSYGLCSPVNLAVPVASTRSWRCLSRRARFCSKSKRVPVHQRCRLGALNPLYPLSTHHAPAISTWSLTRFELTRRTLAVHSRPGVSNAARVSTGTPAGSTEGADGAGPTITQAVGPTTQAVAPRRQLSQQMASRWCVAHTTVYPCVPGVEWKVPAVTQTPSGRWVWQVARGTFAVQRRYCAGRGARRHCPVSAVASWKNL